MLTKQLRSSTATAITWIFVALVLAFPAVAVGQPKKVQREAKDLVEQADKSFDQRNYRNAIDQYARSIALVSNNAHAHFWKGLAHHNLGEDDQALAEFDTAMRQGYKKPLDIYVVRWRIYYAKKNYEAAFADVQQGLRLDSDNAGLLLGLADINLARGAYANAVAAYQKVLQKTPNNPDIYYGLAKAKNGIGDTAGQLAAATEAVNRRTRFLAESWALIGDAYQKDGKQNEALEAYQNALAANPRLYEPYRQMAEIYRAQGRFNDAIEISVKGLKEFPNDGGIYTDLSWYYSLADRHEEAVQAAQTAIRQLPDQSLAYTNLCRAYNDLRRPELAVTACNNALRLSPNDGETLFYLGRAYDLAGRKADANRAYKGAVVGLIEFTQKNPNYSDGFYLLGNAYFADNQPQKAIEAYERCLQLSPRFAKARFNLGFIQSRQNNRAAALEQYNSLLQLDPVLAGRLKAEIDKP